MGCFTYCMHVLKPLSFSGSWCIQVVYSMAGLYGDYDFEYHETELLQFLSAHTNRYDQPWHSLPIQWTISYRQYPQWWLVATFASGWQEWCLSLVATCFCLPTYICGVFDYFFVCSIHNLMVVCLLQAPEEPHGQCAGL